MLLEKNDQLHMKNGRAGPWALENVICAETAAVDDRGTQAMPRTFMSFSRTLQASSSSSSSLPAAIIILS